MQQYDYLDLLQFIDPSTLSYQEWVDVGMALKAEGYTASDWDRWSQNDSRYHKGECFKKWDSFTGEGITAGTLVMMAKKGGWLPPRAVTENRELNWDDEINDSIIDQEYLEPNEVREPTYWNPVNDLIKYLETLFESEDKVGYVTNSWINADGKHVPSKGNYDRTAGQLIDELQKCNGDIGSVLGDYDKDTGAWIRFNPLDGDGVKNANVTDYRYALVESDSMDLGKQNAIIRELELPVACLVYSGGKSVHAIVKVDAGNYQEYRKRVEYLYGICAKNGLDIDKQNRNPSRLSRMPGVIRGEHKQFLMDTNIGKEDWNEWVEWIESANDDLPDPEDLGDIWEDIPPLAEPLIENVLRQGHKMLIAGPSKAGKSFALIELCIAIAEGHEWMGFSCRQGKVMYVNLELDRASCLHRFKDVYSALGIEPKNATKIDIWNLRGKSIPLDKLAPKLIRRAAKKGYIAIVIDPIYKVITGDENSASEMARFTNQFDKICTELGTAVIYCHHHSKGSQSQKRSMDRASGSGVFARDPDAMLDMIELDLTDEHYSQMRTKKACDMMVRWLDRNAIGWRDQQPQDIIYKRDDLKTLCLRYDKQAYYGSLENDIAKALASIETITAWRIDGTLREFPKFKPINLYFEYPTHKVDSTGVLNDIQLETTKQNSWKSNFKKKKTPEERREELADKTMEAYETVSSFNEDGEVTLKEMAEYLGVTDRTIRRRIDDCDNLAIKNGNIVKF